MQIKLMVAKIVTEEREALLTVKVARQFEVDLWLRIDAAAKGMERVEPLGKVLATTIVKDSGRKWLLLVPDPVAGCRWEAPAQFRPDFLQSVLERGGWADDLEQIPMIVLGE